MTKYEFLKKLYIWVSTFIIFYINYLFVRIALALHVTNKPFRSLVFNIWASTPSIIPFNDNWVLALAFAWAILLSTVLKPWKGFLLSVVISFVVLYVNVGYESSEALGYVLLFGLPIGIIISFIWLIFGYINQKILLNYWLKIFFIYLWIICFLFWCFSYFRYLVLI